MVERIYDDLTPRQLYTKVLKVVNFFLENAKHLTLSDLREFDPSVEQLANDLALLTSILQAVAGSSYEDNDMAVNAFQCSLIMEQIVRVVMADHSEHEELAPLMRQLETHANAP